MGKTNTKSEGQNRLTIVILKVAKRHEGSLMIRREHREILPISQNNTRSM